MSAARDLAVDRLVAFLEELAMRCERSRLRTVVGGRSRMERGNVAAFWNLDPDRIVAAAEQIIALEAAPQPACLDADDRIALRVEAVVAAEDSEAPSAAPRA